MGKTKIKGGQLHDGMKGFTDLDAAVANNAECGCGWVCDGCFSYFVLFDYDSENGNRIGQIAMSFEDGAPVYDTVANTRARQRLLNSWVDASSVVISGCPVADLDSNVSETSQLTVAVLPAGSNQAGVWSSDDDLIATVSVAGLITAVDEGSAIITFTSTDGSFTDTCAVTVVIAATGVTMSACPGGALTHPDTAQLTVVVDPTATDQTGVWDSGTPGTATVDASGLVTTVAAGSTTITFTSTDGSFTDTCDITVV